MKRRDLIQLGLGIGGFGLTDLLRAQAATPARKSDVRCIFIWLDGGPSHYETFDPKPDAPKEIRGEFGTVKTPIPGVHFSEHVPKLAAIADRYTVIRSIAHSENNHGAGNHYLTTGHPTPVPVGCGAHVTFHPSMGSVVSWKRGAPNGMPPYISMPTMTRSGGPNFLGSSYSPFLIDNDPNRDGFRVRDVSLPAGINAERAVRRRELRKSLDRLQRINEAAAADPAVSFDAFYEQGYQLVYSESAQAAFDIEKEPKETRELYGRNVFGQRLLLARRLTEAGVPFVTVNYGGWDHHTNIFKTLKDNHLPKIDEGIAGLIQDLDQRGTLDNTLVVCLGEFGRTPKVNERGGRDHWSFAMSVLMAGAGVPRGQIVGATDVKGYYASDNVYAPEDFAASIYHKMGIDHSQILHTPANRPVMLVNKGRLINELFA